MSVYRYIDAQIESVGRYDDPPLSEVLGAMAAFEAEVLGRAITNGKARPYKRLTVIPFSDYPENLTIAEDELVSLHYPQRRRQLDETTPTSLGQLVKVEQTIIVSVLVGLRAWGMPMLAARSANIPYLWESAYRANALLPNVEGDALILHEEMRVGESTYGLIGLPNRPVGWSFTVTLPLSYNMRSYAVG